MSLRKYVESVVGVKLTGGGPPNFDYDCATAIDVEQLVASGKVQWQNDQHHDCQLNNGGLYFYIKDNQHNDELFCAYFAQTQTLSVS